ncbi:hypothetical protein VCHA41O246_150058 [Vibrio chagasii]|nr:hypothetical protein VCHA41O246_150058 [Vibrio chagasii]
MYYLEKFCWPEILSLTPSTIAAIHMIAPNFYNCVNWFTDNFVSFAKFVPKAGAKLAFCLNNLM